MRKSITEFGPWAIVTGASSGIGAEFSLQLAAQGRNVVLVARSEAKLKSLASRIESEHGVDTRVVPLDLSQPGFVGELHVAIADLDIGIVVSNAGAAAMGALAKIDLGQLRSMLRLNTEAHLELSHHFVEEFVARDRGGIVFVGSTAGLQATPYAANYSGSKAYIHNLGQALNHELRNTNVHVSVVAPGPTKTPALTDRTDIDLNQMPAPVMPVDRLVRLALMGLEKNKPLVVAGLPNRMMDWMGRRFLGHRGSRNMWGMLMEKNAPPSLQVRGAPAG